nr:hypothetical protein Iba_chr12aCG9070 [Ipomoea batatas]
MESFESLTVSTEAGTANTPANSHGLYLSSKSEIWAKEIMAFSDLDVQISDEGHGHHSLGKAATAMAWGLLPPAKAKRAESNNLKLFGDFHEKKSEANDGNDGDEEKKKDESEKRDPIECHRELLTPGSTLMLVVSGLPNGLFQ